MNNNLPAKGLSLTLILLAAMLSSCAPNSAGKTNKTAIGTLGGAAAGAAIGSTIGRGSGQIAAITIGAMLGAAAGHSIGQDMDDRDIAAQQQARIRALEYNQTGHSVTWRNPDTHISGVVTPVRTYQNKNGRYCREFTQKVIIGGKTQEAYGQACRQEDGNWEVQQ